MSLPGLSSTNFLPAIFYQTVYAAGVPSAVIGNKKICLMGNCVSTSWAATNNFVDGYVYGPDQPAPFTIQTENDVINAFGAGSELHRGFKKCVASNGGASPIYLVPVKESTGTAASLAVTFTTSAAANGTVAIFIGDTQIQAPITSGDAVATIATNVASTINALANVPVTASPSSGVVTLTAKQKGPRGNQIRVALRIVGTSVSTTSSAQNFAYLASGATADSWTNALATINPLKFDYIVPAAEDATSSTSLGGVATQIENNVLPLVGIEQRFITAHTGTEGTAATFVQSLDTPVGDCVWEQNSNYTRFELAAYTAGMVALGESASVPQLNWDNMGASPTSQAQWQLLAPFDGTVQTQATLVAALQAGLSPVNALAGGRSSLISLITTYCLNGSNPDYRVRDHATVTVMLVASALVKAKLAAQFSNKLIADDPPKGAKPPTSGVVTPSDIAAAVGQVFSGMYANGLIQDLPGALTSINVAREPGRTDRVDISYALRPISLLHQFAVQSSQLTP